MRQLKNHRLIALSNQAVTKYYFKGALIYEIYKTIFNYNISFLNWRIS